jgi:hypothetical protein
MGPRGHEACSDETKSSEHAAGFSQAAAGVKPRSFEVAPRKILGISGAKRGPVLREAPVSTGWGLILRAHDEQPARPKNTQAAPTLRKRL